MTGRDGNHGGGGQGRGRGGRGKGRVGSRTPSTTGSKMTGAVKDLSHHMFDYGTKGAAEQLATTWDKIVNYIGITLGDDIRTKLYTEQRVELQPPTYPLSALRRHQEDADMTARHNRRLLSAKRVALVDVQSKIELPDADVSTLAIREAKLSNEIERFEKLIASPSDIIELIGSEKMDYDSKCKVHESRLQALELN